MLVYDINKNLSFGILLTLEPETLDISTYTFKENVEDAGEFQSIDNLLLMEKIDVRHTLNIGFADLKALPEWEDYTLWDIVVKDFSSLELSKPINRNSFTMASKINRAGFINIFSSIVLELVVPHHTVKSFEEIGIAVTTGKGFSLISNVPCLEKDHSLPEDSGMGQSLRQRMLPGMTISGPTTLESNGIAEYEVAITADGEPFPYPVTVFLESDIGYLPVRRLEVVHTGMFKVRAADLDAGQIIRLKGGFKYWSALTRKEISVI
jgi:hypothetical protein